MWTARMDGLKPQELDLVWFVQVWGLCIGVNSGAVLPTLKLHANLTQKWPDLATALKSTQPQRESQLRHGPDQFALGTRLMESALD